MPVRKEGRLADIIQANSDSPMHFFFDTTVCIALIKNWYHVEIFLLTISDAERALQLLEGYHAKLTKPQDQALRSAIERVIRIFKSNLFHSLLGM
jgi:hypothetical protein